jgi:hypothetical protein
MKIAKSLLIRQLRLNLKYRTDWKDSKTSKIYTRSAQRSKLARQAVTKIDWGSFDSVLPHPNSGEEFRDKNKEK